MGAKPNLDPFMGAIARKPFESRKPTSILCITCNTKKSIGKKKTKLGRGKAKHKKPKRHMYMKDLCVYAYMQWLPDLLHGWGDDLWYGLWCISYTQLKYPCIRIGCRKWSNPLPELNWKNGSHIHTFEKKNIWKKSLNFKKYLRYFTSILHVF